LNEFVAIQVAAPVKVTSIIPVHVMLGVPPEDIVTAAVALVDAKKTWLLAALVPFTLKLVIV
jgi:hypothetical protein